MRIIKYFFEEPTLLDFPAEEEGSTPTRSGLEGLMRKHRHYRGYLAASDLASNMVGGSALEDSAAAEVLARVIGGPIWFSNRVAGQDDIATSLLSSRRDIVQALSTMGSDSVMMMDVDPTEKLVKALTDDNDRKVGMRLIAELLDGGCTLTLSGESPHRERLEHLLVPPTGRAHERGDARAPTGYARVCHTVRRGSGRAQVLLRAVRSGPVCET